MIDEALPPVQEDSSSRGQIVRAVAIAAGLYFLYALAVGILNRYTPALSPVFWALLGLGSTIAYMLVVLSGIRVLAALKLSARLEWAFFGGSLLLYLSYNPLIWQAVRLLISGKGIWQVFAALTVEEMSPELAAVVAFLFILTGTFAGMLLSRIVRERAMLVPVALIAGLIDFWGVYWGPVSVMSESAPIAVGGLGSATTVAASVPQAAMQKMPASLAVLAQIAPPETIGLGDFVFLAFFLACACRLGFSSLKTLWGLFAGLLLASAIMGLDGHRIFGSQITIEYLPGLVFICGGVLLANIGSWRLSRQEWVMTMVPVVLIGGLISYSILRVEREKPRQLKQTYTVTASTIPAAIEAAAGKLKHQGELIILQTRCEFGATGKSPVLWQAFVIRRQQPVDLKTSWEYIVMGKPGKKQGEWTVVVIASSPPSRFINASLAQLQAKKGDVAAIIRGAKPVPPSAYRLLTEAPTIAAELKAPKKFFIFLGPSGGAVVNEQGKQVKQLAYKD